MAAIATGLALATALGGCHRAEPTDGSESTASATPLAPRPLGADGGSVNPFPEHPGFVKTTIVATGETKVVPAAELPDDVRFLYSVDANGKKESRAAVVERVIHSFDKNMQLVPPERASTGVMVLYGEGHKELQSIRLDYER